MAKVYSPNKNYDGITAGVQFSNGIGESDDKYILGYLKSKGYKVEENKKDDIDIELEELKREATELNINFRANIGKDKLKEKIEEAKKLAIPSKEIEASNNQENDLEDDNLDDFFEDTDTNTDE